MRVFTLAAAALAALLPQPAWSAGMTKRITLPNGVTGQVTVLVPEAQAERLEAQGFTRSNAFDTLEKATRHRDRVCSRAAQPSGGPGQLPARAKAPLSKICEAAQQAVAEWK